MTEKDQRKLELEESKKATNRTAEALKSLRASRHDRDALVRQAETAGSDREKLLKQLIASRLQKGKPLISAKPEIKQIAEIALEKEILIGQIEVLSEQLHDAEDEFQRLLNESFVPPIRRLYNSFLTFHLEKAQVAISALLCPEAAVLQKATVQQLAWITQKVIDVRQVEPRISDVISSPLHDTPARKFSEIREETFQMIETEANYVLKQAEKLIEAVEKDNDFLVSPETEVAEVSPG